MKLRTARKIVKITEAVGLEESTRRYSKATISKAQRICEGQPTEWPHPDKTPQTATIQVKTKAKKPKSFTVIFGEPFEIPAKVDKAAVYEELKRVGFVARDKKRKRLRETYKSLKERNRPLAKFKFPNIKDF